MSDTATATALCHWCDTEQTEWTCEQCEEPTCEDCMVKMTIQNQIDFNLCLGCDGTNDARRCDEHAVEIDRENAATAKRDERNAASRARYRRPENVEKRRKARRALVELRRKQYAESLERVAEIFRGMF